MPADVRVDKDLESIEDNIRRQRISPVGESKDMTDLVEIIIVRPEETGYISCGWPRFCRCQSYIPIWSWYMLRTLVIKTKYRSILNY